jgi:hypothetical protein
MLAAQTGQCGWITRGIRRDLRGGRQSGPNGQGCSVEEVATGNPVHAEM